MNVVAQNWAPFPLDETSEWRVHRLYPISGVAPPPIGHYDCIGNEQLRFTVTDSVVVDGLTYLQFAVSGTSNTNADYGCTSNMEPTSYIHTALVRTEEGVYYRRQGLGPETVVADFNQGVGDTVPGYPTMVIDSINHVNINGQQCIRQHLSYTGFGEYVPSVWLTEGVGSNHGTFLHQNLSNSQQSISVCYQEFGSPVLVDNEHVGACFITGVNQLEDVDKPKIHPNPSTGIFNLDLQQQFSYQVFDLFGKLVHEGNSSGQSIIDLTSQPSGVYLLKVNSEQGSFAQKLVKQ